VNLIVDSGHLPVGWQVKKLGDLCHLISGQHIEAKDYNIEHRGIGYLTGPSDFGLLYPVVSKWTEFPKKNASKGDILITVKGSGVGKINILLDDEVAIGRQLMAIRPIEVHSDFLYAFLKLQFYFFQGLANGAAIPGLSRQDILGLEIPIPPLPEQKRIMVILDEAFEGIDRAIANTEKNLANSHELFESYLNAIFSQKDDGWVEKKLGEVCSIGDGNYSSKYPKASEFVSEGVPFLTATNLKSGTIVPDNIRYISKEQHFNLIKGHVIKDDLVIVVRGSSTGNNSIIPEEYEGSVMLARTM